MSHLQSLLKPQPAFFSPKHPSRTPHFRIYRRRRLKPGPSRHQPLRCYFSGFDKLLSSQLAHDVFTSLLGFASASAAAFSISSLRRNSSLSDVGEWILFSSPTPFNRFVLLRCLSVAFEGSELLEDVNDRLVKEERHFVRINSGRIQMQLRGQGDKRNSDCEARLLKYQRMCVPMEDGGMISLDWPENLDLKEERGLDTTLLLVPGTAQGSMDADVKAFVCEALSCGFFPVVMNPRGCAGSPLTTARLFTAADSDDIHRATQFISKVRPWTTLMAVGWGLGANMLTKYLAEVGEKTPITAATCINNPFDLEEATRSSPHSRSIDERLTAGLKDILIANKELFQGRAKGFDVERALSAKTVRNFDQAISMVSYGFEEIAEFYSKSSTRNLVGDLKVPVLFIQSDDGTVPLFSIPRGEIAENPYTSLLLCSSLSSGGTGKPALSWCQHLTVEWLAAVELGFLKGRHPLLEDIDISISPSRGLSLVECSSLDQSGEEDKLLEFSNDLNGYTLGTTDNMIEDRHGVSNHTSGSWHDPQSGSEGEDKDIKVVDNGVLQQSSSGDVLTERGIEESSTDVDDEGQGLQSAQVVMNMLDMTLPGVFTEEKKEKVLAAMNQGETLMKALEDAVPEDVRGKLTTSVSGILAAQGAKLRFHKMNNGLHNNNLSPDLMQKVENSGSSGSNDNHEVTESHFQMPKDSSETDLQMPKDSSKSELQMRKDTSESELQMPKDSCKFGSGGDSEGHFGGKPSSPAQPNKSENESEPKEAAAVEVETNSNTVESVAKGLTEEKNMGSPIIAEVEPHTGFSESQTTEKDTDDDQKNENKGLSPSGVSESQAMKKDTDDQKNENMGVQPVLDQKKASSAPGSNMPPFSASQALDALAGIDDSTQVAVNSVFGVLEEMITQLEEGSDNQKENESEEKQIDSSLQKHDITQHKSASIHQDKAQDSRPEIGHEYELEEPNQSFDDVDGSSEKKDSVNIIGKEKNYVQTRLVNSKLLDSFGYNVGHADSIPFYATPKPYEEFVRDGYNRRHLLSKIPPKSLDMDTTTAMFLEYIPEESHWKFLEEPGQDGDSSEANEFDEHAEENRIANVIDAPYMVQGIQTTHYVDKEHGKKSDRDDSRAVELKHLIKKIIYDCLRIEVDRRIHPEDRKEFESSLIRDFDLVGDAVCSTIANDKDMTLAWKTRKNGTDYAHQKLGTLNGGKIVNAVSSAIQETDHLRRLLPIGLVVGSCLAALREYFVITEQDSVQTETDSEVTKNTENVNRKLTRVEPLLVKYSRDTDVTKENAHHIDQQHNEKSNEDIPEGLLHQDNKEKQIDDAHNNTVMAGMVSAALGTTAFLVHQQGPEEGDGNASSSIYHKQRGGAIHKDLLEEESSQKDQTNLVTSLAEKAMSVAAPVVPTREDGEVDQEKVVAMLADLGQRGGMLKLIGKVALLWGGLRGAMSLTDKLISFLRIAERPVLPRIIGFMFMVLVLWSPVVVPLLPTLVQGWMSNNNSPKMAELACIVGLYAAVMILLMIWGRRIRGYEKPFQQYGLDFTSIQKVQDLLKGLVGGIVLVSAIQYTNVTLGYMSFSLPPHLFSASTSSAVVKLKFYGTMLAMAGQAIVTAGTITLVEELLFRSWLPAEIAADLGYHWGIFLSGLIFALTQRPLWAVPGLLLWSISLSGLRRINNGSLSIPIGLRTGILTSNHILQTGGFLTYKTNFPQWITGTQPFQPFSGIVGLTFSLLMAAILYPRGVKPKKLKLSRPIREE